MTTTMDKCYYPLSFLSTNLCFACLYATLASIAFFQLARIRQQDKRGEWTRQQVLHLMVGSSNIGYFIYFVTTTIVTCKKWHHWSSAFGFFLMAFPKILFLATFLLLLSFWVDICHHGNDEYEENIIQVLLEKEKSKSDYSRKCCSFQGVHIGTRQKFVVAVCVILFFLMISFTMFIWIGTGKNHIDSSVVAKVYVDVFAAMVLITGVLLGFYGVILFYKLRNVRSEQIASDISKVSGLAIVSVVCFTISAILALLTNIPLFYHWNPSDLHGVKALILLIIYYFIGSIVPSTYVLWVMRDLPPPNTDCRHEEPREIDFVNYQTRFPEEVICDLNLEERE